VGLNGSYTIALSETFDKRLQPVNISVTAGGVSVMNLTYGFNLGSGDNGNVMSIANNNNGQRTQTMTYDSLNRIASAKTTATSGSDCWGVSYGIDQWGNWLTGAALSGYSGCAQGLPSFSVNSPNGYPATNQLSNTGFTYDAAGEMTNDGTAAYVYDAEGRQSSAAGVNYTYDGDGQRVEKSNGMLNWYGVGGEVLSETDLNGNNGTDYVYFGGERLAPDTEQVCPPPDGQDLAGRFWNRLVGRGRRRTQVLVADISQCSGRVS